MIDVLATSLAIPVAARAPWKLHCKAKARKSQSPSPLLPSPPDRYKPTSQSHNPTPRDGALLRHLTVNPISHAPQSHIPLSRFCSACQEDLWGDADAGRESPRFTLLILDVEEQGAEGGLPGAVAVPCAVVIIPRGRDRDFTFSSREGLEQVTATLLRRVYASSF